MNTGWGRVGLILCLCVSVLSGCSTLTTAVQSPIIAPQAGTLSAKEVVVDNPTSAQAFSRKVFIPQNMANSIALDVAKRFPSMKVVRPQRYATIADNLRRSNLVFSPDAVGGGYMELELEVLSWSPGNALARSLTAGISNSGEATLSVKATLIDASQSEVKSKPVAESVFTTASRGNLLYTGTAEDPWSRAADEIAKWLGDQL